MRDAMELGGLMNKMGLFGPKICLEQVFQGLSRSTSS